MQQTIFFRIGLICLSATLLTSCGSLPEDRAVSGAAIGAGVGTAAALAVSGGPFTGMLIGAAAGATIGAITDQNDINFGTPIWRYPQ